MAKTAPSSGAVTGEKMAPPSITLLPEKRSPTNGHSSPARTGKNTPSHSDKKPQINGHASPSHLVGNHAGKQTLEGYIKTDDRMRLAKERREERERSLAAREQLMREKERRARLQYERTVEERWRRLEEQRQKEEQRRAAVEEKRRQQLEEDRERLEALMRRSLERSLLLEQRSKRWNRGCHSGAGDSENAPLPFSAASAFSHGIASPLPAVSESAPCSPHRSPFCSNPADHSRAGLKGGSQSTPNTPKKERLRRERRTASPGCGSPLRRSASPAGVAKHLASPTTSRLATKMRSHSPSNAHQYHYSPTRLRANIASDDRKAENKKLEKQGDRAESPLTKNTDTKGSDPSLQAERNVVNNELAKTRSSKAEASDKRLRGDTPERIQSPDRKVDPSEKKTQSMVQDADKKKDLAPCTGKMAAGTTNAEEATRLLAERRRQARAQKELEEKKREQEEEDRLREEQLWKQVAEEQRQQQEMKMQEAKKSQEAKEKEKRDEEDQRLKEKEEKGKREEQGGQNGQVDKEREKAKVQAQEDAERQRQDRELLTQQEEEERQLRKKRIEEIMKRTRKAEADLKDEQVETEPPGDVKTVGTHAQQVNEREAKKVEVQVKELVPAQVTMKECSSLKKEPVAAAAAAAAAAQMDNQRHVNNNTCHVTPTQSVPEKRAGAKQTSDASKEVRACDVKQQITVKEEKIEKVKATDQTKEEPAKVRADAKVRVKPGGMMNGAVSGKGSALMMTGGRQTDEGSKQQSPRVAVNANGGFRVGGVRASGGHLSPPVIKLEPLNVKRSGSCDEVQSMEVSPASKEELISIPEFSPVNEIHSGLSNTRALEDLMDLTGGITYSKLTPDPNVGDCNKNLIEGVVSPMSDSKLIGMSQPSPNKLSIQ